MFIFRFSRNQTTWKISYKKLPSGWLHISANKPGSESGRYSSSIRILERPVFPTGKDRVRTRREGGHNCVKHIFMCAKFSVKYSNSQCKILSVVNLVKYWHKILQSLENCYLSRFIFHADPTHISPSNWRDARIVVLPFSYRDSKLIISPCLRAV